MYKNEPIWNAETINRKKGDTNFQTCGWCKHGGSGGHRYDCMVDGKCNLLKDYQNEVAWDTECKLTTLGKEDLTSIIESKEQNIKSYESSIIKKKEEIKQLSELHKDADGIPPLPQSRQHDHFNLEDEIMIYPTFTEATIRDTWLKGIVISGYRHHDGCISGYIDKKYHDGDNLDGHGYGSGSSNPLVLLKKEYDYFVDNPNKFKPWIKESASNSFKIDYINVVTPN